MATKGNGTKTTKTTTKPFVETTNSNNEKVTSYSYADWDKAVQAQADKWKEQGKNVYYSRDDNGALHASTISEARAKEIAKTYNTGASSSYNIGGKTYEVQTGDSIKKSIDDAVSSVIEQYTQYLNGQNTDNTAALEAARAASAEQANRTYDDAARNYYQLYKTQTAQLPETLSKAGVTGGASESAQISLMNNYANNLYNNESGRNNALAGINQDYNDKIAENSVNTANSMASAYLQLAQQQLQYQQEDRQAAAEAQATAQTEAEKTKIETWNANVRARMAEQLKKGDTIWTWTDKDGRVHWSTYENIGMSNGGKKLEPSSAKNSKSSKSGSSSGGGGGKIDDDEPKVVKEESTNDKNSSNYDYVLRMAKVLTTSPATYTQAVKYVKGTKLTTKQKEKILKAVGLL